MHILFLVIVRPGIGFAQGRIEEFNLPFASWENIKTKVGAKGDGKTDGVKGH